MSTRTLLLALAASAASMPVSTTITGTTPLISRDVIGHDAVVGFPETVPDSTLGQLYLAYQPYLYVESGCVPFPAVDAEGNTSGGLAPSGSPSGDCSSSTGQIYARSTMASGTTSTYGNAIMYSWYFPKDSPSTGLGHRHEWEGVIIYLSDASSTSAGNVLAVCPSAHGDWNCDTSFSLGGTHPLIRYYSTWPVNHQLGLTETVGGSQPLVAWESLTEAAQGALESTDFGDATVPFKEGTFAGNLASATY
ncbi:NPP1 domain protein [Aspergillus granulosus]|uniref:NPP1 domain protein n=1 Tax=Aspergillus granulosus TaxID=176169 RepID=A0ABR4HB97_9EURO